VPRITNGKGQNCLVRNFLLDGFLRIPLLPLVLVFRTDTPSSGDTTCELAKNLNELLSSNESQVEGEESSQYSVELSCTATMHPLLELEIFDFECELSW
jgi:hypothetical protein